MSFWELYIITVIFPQKTFNKCNLSKGSINTAVFKKKKNFLTITSWFSLYRCNYLRKEYINKCTQASGSQVNSLSSQDGFHSLTFCAKIPMSGYIYLNVAASFLHKPLQLPDVASSCSIMCWCGLVRGPGISTQPKLAHQELQAVQASTPGCVVHRASTLSISDAWREMTRRGELLQGCEISRSSCLDGPMKHHASLLSVGYGTGWTSSLELFPFQ